MSPKIYRSLALMPFLACAYASVASAVPVVANAGFEADTFTTFPGYITGAGNGPVTGWTATTNANQGINPGGGSPFANNGTIPEGTQVGFIQGGPARSFTSTAGITGLTAGEQYQLSYRANARSGNQVTMSVAVGGSTLVSSLVNAVGGTNPYAYVVRPFTATGSSMSLAVTSSSGGDNTLLIDDFQVTSKPTTPWTDQAWTGDADSGIDPSGNVYTHAYNFGNSAVNTTINGVDFTAITGANPMDAGKFSLTAPNAFGTDTNNVTGNSAALANSFVFNGNPSVLTINGLNAGQRYRTSIFGVGFDASGNRTATFEADGERLTVDENQFGNNNGLRIDFDFIATGSSRMITIDPLGSSTFHIYGFANAAPVPEPSTLGLAALGLLSLGWTRRRARS